MSDTPITDAKVVTAMNNSGEFKVQVVGASLARTLERQLATARAQLAEAEEAVKIQNGVIVVNTKKLIAARANAERRLEMMQELIRLKDLKIEITSWNPDYVGGRAEIADYVRNKPLIWEAIRREVKEYTNNNNQSKEQESSAVPNTKLGGESVGLDHRVTSPIQSEPKT